jgi:hypothetical protein
MIFVAVHLFDLQLTMLCLNSNSQCVFAALVAARSRWFESFVVMTKKEGAMKALALLTAAALSLLSVAASAQTGPYYGKGKAPPPPVVTKG